MNGKKCGTPGPCKKAGAGVTRRESHFLVKDMKRKRRFFFGREEGQAMVESALVIPLLILIVCGVIDFGWIFFNQLEVNNCSREGARYAIVNSEQANLTDLVTDKVYKVAGPAGTNGLSVAVQFQNANQDISVTVTKSISVLTPIAGVFTQNQAINLTSTSVMRVG